MSNELTEIRERLDAIDSALVDDLARRHELVLEIARLKAGGTGALRDVPREEELLARLEKRARAAGLDAFFVRRLYWEILAQSLRVQEAALAPAAGPRGTIRVGYQGTAGAYSHLAAARHFGTRGGAIYVGFDTFEDMLEAVGSSQLDYAVLPIENTISGSVAGSYDLLTRLDLAVVGEEVQEVDHCLLALEDLPLTRIRRVFSHPVALAQCGRFLSTLQDCRVEAFTDTAMAARRVRDEQDLSQAAIASREAGRLYGLTVLKSGVADERENFTRMLIIATHQVTQDLRIPCKTSLVLATRHECGALARCLDVLAQHGLNLTRLESRPRPRNPWEYYFYLDFEGNTADPRVKEALRATAAYTSFLKVLGSYPARTTADARLAEPQPPDGSVEVSTVGDAQAG